MLSDKLSGYLGFAARARMMSTGYNTALFLIAKRKAKLIIVAEDAADAALAASLFHYNELTVGDVKEYLKEKGVPVRL